MTDSQAIVVRRSADLAAIGELEQALLTGEAPAEVELDPEQIQREIIEQLLAATSDEELERREAESWRDNVGVPFEIHDFVWRPSSFNEGQPVFLVVRALRMDDGSPHVLTTGSAQVMAQLANLAKRDRLPAVRRLVENETKAGNKVYHLETPEGVKSAGAGDVRTDEA